MWKDGTELRFCEFLNAIANIREFQLLHLKSVAPQIWNVRPVLRERFPMYLPEFKPQTLSPYLSSTVELSQPTLGEGNLDNEAQHPRQICLTVTACILRSNIPPELITRSTSLKFPGIHFRQARKLLLLKATHVLKIPQGRTRSPEHARE